MQKKKNIQLIISLISLSILTLAVFWFNTKSEFIEVDKNIFKVENLKSVDRVLLESKNSKVELRFNGSRWKVNNKFDADRNLVDVLFATLQQTEPKRPVTNSNQDSIAHNLEQNGLKVSLFSGDHLEKMFFAGGNKQKSQAYFKDPNNITPYVMVIPGYRVYASGIFELDEYGWREKRIFNFNWQNFKSLTATFPSKPTENFKATIVDRVISIEGVSTADTSRLNAFMDGVSLIGADHFVAPNLQPVYDSLLPASPFMIIEVRDVADRMYQLLIYPPFKNEVVGELGDKTIAIFSPKTIVPIIKQRNYFIIRP